MVAKIVKAGHRCALSGWEISPQCFELDHIVSMNDGGADDIDNLQAVHPLVNRAKGTMGNDQFVAMCIAVANYVQHGDQRATQSEIESVKKAIQDEMTKDYAYAPHRN